jgi:hypothetical protein
MSLRLAVLPGRLAVCRLPPEDAIPEWASAAGGFSSVTRTRDELSVVCAEAAVPEGIRSERGWRALVVAGPLDFGLIGVIASLAEPLARAGVPIFVLSTFDTDYLLVQEARLAEAGAALAAAGHDISGLVG